jgi:hypothetical protein
MSEVGSSQDVSNRGVDQATTNARQNDGFRKGSIHPKGTLRGLKPSKSLQQGAFAIRLGNATQNF